MIARAKTHFGVVVAVRGGTVINIVVVASSSAGGKRPALMILSLSFNLTRAGIRVHAWWLPGTACITALQML
eukprot:443962-Lingulodinium_polyedra.AAC.1